MRHGLKRLPVVIVLLWATLVCAYSMAFDITGLQYNPSSQVLTINTNGLPSDLKDTDYRFVRLNNNKDLAISMPRATSKIKGNNVGGLKGISSATLTPLSGQAGVLLKLQAQSPQFFQNMQFAKNGNNIAISLKGPSGSKPPTPTSSSPAPPKAALPVKLPSTAPTPPPTTVAPQKLHQLEYILPGPSGIVIAARSEDTLSVKNQFILDNPKRLVIDLSNTELGTPTLKQAITPNTGTISSVRAGQFDETTVRVVIESPNPQALSISKVSGRPNQLSISSSAPSITANTPATATISGEALPIGIIEDVWIEKLSATSARLKISSSVPMLPQFNKQGPVYAIQLTNLVGRQAPVYFPKADLPFIQSIQVAPLQSDAPNLRIITRFDRESYNTTSHLSKDGKYLEITLEATTAKPSTASSSTPDEDLVPFVMPTSKGKGLIVVDAGHGGKDVGATRVGVFEKDINLAVALKLRSVLQQMGYTVVMTRDVDKFLELSQITAISNKVKPDAFVSVHVNSAANTTVRGLETFFYWPKSEPLSEFVHAELVSHIKTPDRAVRKAKFYVINHNDAPAILCEIGYITNAQERAELQTPERQLLTAQSIAKGVHNFLRSQKK